MAKCGFTREVERWFDGEPVEPEPIKRHLTECASCAAYLAQLETLRHGVSASLRHEAIHETQFPAFMSGIREKAGQPIRWRGIWALASVAAAALIVAASVLFVVSDGPSTVDAVVIESCSTEIEGATVSSYASEDGVATVWVDLAPDDIP